MLVLATAQPASALAPHRPPAVVVAVVPGGATPAQLGHAMPGAALGLMSAGIGPVPVAQTYLDVSQGNRVNPSLYDGPLPAMPRSHWGQVRRRASDVPADIVPGLLGTTLERGGVAVQAGRGAAGLMAINERGQVPAASAKCRSWRETNRMGSKGDNSGLCPGVTVVRASLADVRALAAQLRGSALLIAFSAPPPTPDHETAIAIAGRGFQGQLTSASTHTSGLVVSTDLAPTILDRLGIATPSAMNGQPVTASGQPDAAALSDLEARLAAVPDRRPQTIPISAFAWLALAAIAALAFRPRGIRVAIAALAASFAYLPAALLLTASIAPSSLAETLIVAIATPLAALATVYFGGAWGGLAIAAGVTAASYAVCAITGSDLPALSLLGPNPAGGIRFYGIGNELEAFAVVLVPVGVGAALTQWRPRTSPRAAALAFALAALAAVLAFAPGRFGADVGAAIDLPIAAAVAVAVCLGAGRIRTVAIVVAVPLVALGALALIDLVSGGDSHLTRSVLDAGGLGDLGQVAQRRLILSADNFGRYAGSPALWAAVALIALGIAFNREIVRWFAGRPYAWAGFAGAIAGGIAAVLANDAGALVLMIITALLALTAFVAWATRRERALRLR